MHVLVTGGTGFVGGWTAKAVADAGHDVRFLVRDPARLAGVASVGVDTSDHVVGDITDARSVRRALDGCDAVVHTAAVVATDPTRAAEMTSTNLAGATAVLGQAVELGLDPVVHVSSVAAIFDPRAPLLRADLPVVGGDDGYGQSKASVESYARSLQEAGAPVVITYPGMVLGPPVGEQMGESSAGVESVLRLRVVPGRKATWSVVDVRDLGLLHAALLTPGRGPRRYLAGGQSEPADAIAGMLATAAGSRIRLVPVPDAWLRGFGRVADRVRPVLPDSLRDFTGAGMVYYTQMPPSDDSPAASDLGVSFRSTRETLEDTVTGLQVLGRA